FPLVAANGTSRYAHTLLVRRAVAGVDKAGCPVLFSGDVGAPGRGAVTAVIVGAAHLRAVGREGGLDPVRATHRASQFHGRGRGEAAVVARVLNDVPAAIGATNMDDGHAVGVDFLAYFFCRPLAIDQGRPIGVQGFFINVFVVDGQQALGRASFQGEEVHAVMVHAHGVEQVVGAVIAVLVPRQGIVIDWRTPRGQYMGNVAGRNDT